MSTSPVQPLRRDSRIFISAATRDLGTVRPLVKKALEENDYHAIEQSTFPTDYRDLIDRLRERISSCDAVIHIAGFCSGAEPKTRPPDTPRRSFTQIEYYIALELGKPIYLFVTTPAFEPDKHDIEDPELAGLQEEHRRVLTSTTKSYQRVASREELDQKVRSLQLRVDAALEELTRVDVQVSALRQELPERIQESHVNTVQALTDPVLLADSIRKAIEARAQVKIVALPSESGRWRKIIEIERQRDFALAHVAELLRLLQSQLKEGGSEILGQAADILQKEGADDALAYLEKQTPSIIDSATQISKRVKTENELLHQELAPLQLRADLMQLTFDLNGALDLRKKIAELAPNWFDARSRLAVLLAHLARFPEAETHARAASVLAANPKEEAAALGNLGELCQETNRRAEAEPLMRQALALVERGGGSPLEISLRLNSLAQLLKELNRMNEAEPLLRRALKCGQEEYGADHMAVVKSLNNLADLLTSTNQLAEAEPLLRQALEISEKTYGPVHPQTSAILSNLSAVLVTTGRAEEAIPLLARSVANTEYCYGPEHPEFAKVLNNFANGLRAVNRPADAEAQFRRVVAVNEKVYGPNDPRVAASLNNLAYILHSMNRSAEAENPARRALAIDEKTYGAEHPYVATDLNTLALVLKAVNRPGEAEPLMRRALEIDTKASGADSPRVAIELTNLGILLGQTNRMQEAEPLLRRAAMILHDFGRKTGYEHENMQKTLDIYRQLLQAMRLSARETAERLRPFVERT
jgi:tetratricopeptide (TPR) repeat protein